MRAFEVKSSRNETEDDYLGYLVAGPRNRHKKFVMVAFRFLGKLYLLNLLYSSGILFEKSQ